MAYDFLGGFLEHVANAWTGGNVFGVARIGLDLLSEASDKRFKNVGIATLPPPPDFAQKLVMSNHSISVRSQRAEKPVLSGSQYNLFSILGHLTVGEVYA